MEKLQIAESADTPLICFDPHSRTLEIEGKSFPENTLEFYTPVLKWLDEYVRQEQQDITLTLKLKYLSSSSYKPILDIFRKLEELHNSGKTIMVNWLYKKGDLDMKETGEEFSDIFQFKFSIGEF